MVMSIRLNVLSPRLLARFRWNLWLGST